MKNENYFVGLDIGTDSVGYAVTNESYDLCKFKGEHMWGVTLFDEAQLAAKRRAFRTARRRLDRRQQRVRLVQDLFAKEINKVDEKFFLRIKESYLYPEKDGDKVRLFDTYEKQKEYVTKYPTVHHLITELMNDTEPHDVRLVYIACAWLVAHRGHFLNAVDKQSIDNVTDFKAVYQKLADFIKHDEYSLPWSENVNLVAVENALKVKYGVIKKSKLLAEALFGGKAPNLINEQYEYNYDLVVKLLCGGKCALKELFGKEYYEDLKEKAIALNTDEQTLAEIMQSVDETDAEFISVLKSVYDWSVLVDILKGRSSISEAKVEVYEQHARDLYVLKKITKNCVPQKYKELFRAKNNPKNYVAYIGKSLSLGEKTSVKKSVNNRDFCKYVLSVLKSVQPDNADIQDFENTCARLEVNDFLPKQVEGDNRVIPYQLYWHELDKILKNAQNYLPFLSERDSEGISTADKILSVFEFKVPYYVGPLKEKRDTKYNHWMVRKAEGKIYPWNFTQMVDLDASENAFIDRMTNSCTYLPEDVLPKCSLVYCAFEVLNEINNIKINGNEIPVSLKQCIYNDLFMKTNKVTPKRIREYLTSNNYISDTDVLSGLDITVKSSLAPFLQFKNLVGCGLLTYSDVEKIINRATYSEDKQRFRVWLQHEFSNLPEKEILYISGLKLKNFGRLSRRFLCGISGADTQTGEVYASVLRAMWETNCNLMQLLSDKFTFKDTVDEIVREYYGVRCKSVSDRLDEMSVSNAVKRPIIRTLDILKDIVKIQGHAPKRIFIEMARGADEKQKNKRTSSRLQQIQELYSKIEGEDVRELQAVLDTWGDTADTKLQSDKLFLYFMQLGQCLYTGSQIGLESIITGDGTYNIEHIYPRCFVKDDSIINNKILVDSKVNDDKNDEYPITPSIQEKMFGLWTRLHKSNLLSDEKFKRLTRKTHFTDEEKYEFINRQLVETRQSTKTVATLLKELYPKTEIVYVKAGLVSEFRQTFGAVKSRAINDLHHAKDAYLNVAVGNVWHSKFSRQFWNPTDSYSIKPKNVFTRPVICGNKTVWNGASDKDRVVNTVRKNTAHMTKYTFCRKGGLFDQMPVSAASGLVPLKNGRPTEIYGGYTRSSATFFCIVRYKVAKKSDVMIMPVELLYADKFISDEAFATEYTVRTISQIVNKPVENVEFLLNRRSIKINTVISLNGFRVCITGKSNGGKRIIVSCMTALKTSPDIEDYIKRLEAFVNKTTKNPNIIFSEKHDEISGDKNIELYEFYIEKLKASPYKYRPANPYETLVEGREKFKALSPDKQAVVLLSIQGIFGRAVNANLEDIGGKPRACEATLSSSLSNWKKNYTDVRIIDQAASGLFEKVSDNLLDLL